MANILMIDDDMNFVRLAEKILRIAGHTLISSSTAFGGLAMASDRPVDLVLLDLDLPDLDGKIVATMLRARPAMAAIPIIAVSAQSEGVAQRMALAFGCSGFIAKPIDTRAFPAQVANYLKRSQS